MIRKRWVFLILLILITSCKASQSSRQDITTIPYNDPELLAYWQGIPDVMLEPIPESKVWKVWIPVDVPPATPRKVKIVDKSRHETHINSDNQDAPDKVKTVDKSKVDSDNKVKDKSKTDNSVDNSQHADNPGVSQGVVTKIALILTGAGLLILLFRFGIKRFL